MLWPWAIVGLSLWSGSAVHSIEVKDVAGDAEYGKRIEFKAAGVLGSQRMVFNVATQLKVNEGVASNGTVEGVSVVVEVEEQAGKK
jgi:hypothetical protein